MHGGATGTALPGAISTRHSDQNDVDLAVGSVVVDLSAASSATSVRKSVQPASWVRPYRAALVAVDVSAAAGAALIACDARFGPRAADMSSVVAFVLALPLAWVSVLALGHAYERRVAGAGASEYQRVLRAFVSLTALVTFVSYVAHLQMSRGFVLL